MRMPLPSAGGVGGGDNSAADGSSLSPSKREQGSADITLAAIVGAHGVSGEVRLKLFGESLESVRAYASFNNGALTLKSLRNGSNGAIARFVEITDRSAAEAHRGTALHVPRTSLPPLAEGEYYHSDIIGLPAVTPVGTPLGHCIAIENFGAGDVLEIEMPAQDGKPPKTFMLPFTRQAVPLWGLQLVIDPAFVV
jgi:16S rRNA processing protein RimM